MRLAAARTVLGPVVMDVSGFPWPDGPAMVSVVRARKQLVHEVREAFAGADRPAPPFVRTDRPHDPWMRELEAAFAAREELDAAFLQQHVFAARHLRPPALRWFVRSLLLELLALRWEIVAYLRRRFDHAPGELTQALALWQP
jgi:hypothetical protein